MPLKDDHRYVSEFYLRPDCHRFLPSRKRLLESHKQTQRIGASQLTEAAGRLSLLKK
jgi:hypothetical protein